MKPLFLLLCTVFGSAAAVCAGQAQAPAGGRVEFAAAIVKPNPDRTLGFFGCRGTDGPAVPRNVPTGRCQGVGSLRLFIQEAYDIPAMLEREWLVGAPEWLDSDRYSIEATSEPAATHQELDRMLQELLRDKFKLAFHREVRPVDGFALTVAKGGPKLQKATGQEEKPGLHSVMRLNRGTGSSQLQTSLTGVNVSVSELAHTLRTSLGHPILDKSELTGNYNFTLPFFGKPDPQGLSDEASIFTLIQQLGLKLESQKVPIEVFVIDHVDKPMH